MSKKRQSKERRIGVKRSVYNRYLSVLLLISMFLSVIGPAPVQIFAEDTPESASAYTCGKEEHIHSEACYEYLSVLSCGNTEEGHIHTDECYEVTISLACDKEEHVHTEACQPALQASSSQASSQAAMQSQASSQEESSVQSDPESGDSHVVEEESSGSESSAAPGNQSKAEESSAIFSQPASASAPSESESGPSNESLPENVLSNSSSSESQSEASSESQSESSQPANESSNGESSAASSDPAAQGSEESQSSAASSDPTAQESEAGQSSTGEGAEGSESSANAESSEASESSETPEVAYPAFSQVAVVDDIEIHVDAAEGVFPEGATLIAQKVTQEVKEKLDEVISDQRPADATVVSSFTFDIKIVDAQGVELQPTDGSKVKVSFVLPEVEHEKLDTQVYHISETPQAPATPNGESSASAGTGESSGSGESTAAQESSAPAAPAAPVDPAQLTPENLTTQVLEAQTTGDSAAATTTVTVETQGFSYYTVEFTYNNKQYVLEGGGVVKLADLLASLNIEGTAVGASVSNPELFNVIMGSADGVRYTLTFDGRNTVRYPVNHPQGTVFYIVSYKPFSTEEWMDVLMQNGETHHIIVTDAIMDNGNNTASIQGLHQGAGSTFADTIPVADIWINQGIVNDSLTSRNSAVFIPGELMTSGNHPGFIGFNAAEAGYTDGNGNTAGHAGYSGNFFVEFDARLETLDGQVTTTRNSDGATVYQSYNYFDGVVGSFKWEDAAIRLNDQGQEEYLDVYVEYSNPMITIETPANASSAASVNDAVLSLFGGNMIALGGQRDTGSGIDSDTGALGFRYGLDLEVRPYVADKSGNPIAGKFYFPMVHLNVDRTPYDGFKQLYGANENYANYDSSLHQYSEQVKIENGLVQNLDGDIVYIKGGAGDSTSYYAQVDYDNGQYTIYPGATAAPGAARSDFYQGFLTLVENGSFSFKYNAATAPNNRSSIETYVMAGTEFNYRLRHTTETLPSSANPNPSPTDGGTIQTTRYGNHSGQLDDGEIIDPAVIATASGQTVVYTFTPQPGYGLRELWVWNGTGASGSGFPSTGDMKNGLGTRIYEGSGDNQYQSFDDDNDGNIDRYVFTFSGIHSDNAIHVVWGQTILDITKRVTGTGTVDDNGNPITETFTFRIKAWGDKNQDGTDEYIDFTTASDDATLNARFTSVGNNLYEFTLQNGETLNISPETIPVGYSWEVTEVYSRSAESEYGTTYDEWVPVGPTVQSGTFVTNDESQHASFLNKRTKVINPERKLTVKKVWENDTTKLRPQKINVFIQKVEAIGVTPDAFKSGIQSVLSRSSVAGIKNATADEYEAARNAGISMQNVSASKGAGSIKMWRSGNNVYFYSEGPIYLMGSAEDMFYNFTNLSDISGLSALHTDFVTSFKRMFGNDKKITNLSPLANWNTANVTNMEKMFAPDSTSAGVANQMSITSLEPLRNWQTQNVTTMKWMFRGGGSGITDVSPLAGWDVDRVVDFTNMFFRTAVANNDLTPLESWNIASGQNFSGMFQNSYSSSPGVQSTPNASVLPDWSSKRGGQWNQSGTYNYTLPTYSPTSDANKDRKDETAFWAANQPVTKTATVHEVDPENSSIWIYEFDVDPGTSWNVYEILPETAKEFYTCSAQNIDGRGLKADPVTGATPGSTTVLTNTRKEYQLRIKKDTDIPTTDVFNFTLTLWTGTTEMANPYDLPDDFRLIQTGVFTKTAPGTYTFTMGAPAAQEVFLPAGVRYRVVEESAAGWSMTNSHNTHGVLNEAKEASFLNTQADLFKVVKLWEGDSANNVIFKTRPTGEMSLGIVVTTIDQSVSGRIQIVSGTLSKVKSTDADFAALLALYNASSDDVTVYDTTGDSPYPTEAARKVQIDGVDHVIDKVSDTELKVMQVESGDHKGTRWKRNGATTTIQTSNTNYASYLAAYNASQINVTDLRDMNGTSTYSTTAPKLVEVGGTDYVYDLLTGNAIKVIPVENIPFTKTYTVADTFFEDDGAGGWLYEYNIPDTEDVISVVETSVPRYYQKIETTTNADGEVSYQITNTLETRNLVVSKTTVDNEPGEFNFGIKFWVENDTSERHPVKVGHSQFLTTEDGEGNPVYEYEFVFESGVTLDGVDVFGPHEVIGDDTVRGTLTKAQAETLVNTLKNITVGAPDAEFTRHNSTGITLADLGLAWNGITSYDFYVEQDQSFVTNMLTNGRRMDWFIIPTPGHDEVITVQTPYILRSESKPSGLTGTGGTYYFTLQNGGSVTFTDLPMGVSYEISEFRKSGWDEVSATNEIGTMTNGAVEKWIYGGTEYTSYQAALTAAQNGGGTAADVTKKAYDPIVSLFTNEREKGSIKVVKETVQEEAGTFTFRAMTGRVADPANVKDQSGAPVSITRIYPEGKAAYAGSVTVTEHPTYVAYFITEGPYQGAYRLYRDGHVTFDENSTNDPANGVNIGQLFNYVYPYQLTTMDGMNYLFSYTTDPDTGDTTASVVVESTTFEFQIATDGDSSTEEYVTIDEIPYGSRDKIWEVGEKNPGWKLVSVDEDTSKTEIDATMSTDQTVTHTFLNDRDTVSLTIGKEVSGNQGSRDKYFMYTVTLANAGERTIHLDMTDATREFAEADKTVVPNSATVYTRGVIETANQYDDDAGVTYGSVTSETMQKNCEWNDGTYTYKWNADDQSWEQYQDGAFVTNDGVTVPSNATRTFAHGQHINVPSSGTVTITFYLQAGQTATLRDVPFGSSYTVTEVSEDYKPYLRIEDGGDGNTGESWQTDGSISAGSPITIAEGQASLTDSFLKEDTEVTFTNVRHGAVPTEIRFGFLSWLPIVILPLGGLLFVLKRRRKDRWEPENAA